MGKFLLFGGFFVLAFWVGTVISGCESSTVTAESNTDATSDATSDAGTDTP